MTILLGNCIFGRESVCMYQAPKKKKTHTKEKKKLKHQAKISDITMPRLMESNTLMK